MWIYKIKWSSSTFRGKVTLFLLFIVSLFICLGIALSIFLFLHSSSLGADVQLLGQRDYLVLFSEQFLLGYGSLLCRYNLHSELFV